ncbi:hypothetical protein [Streptomyces sp. NBC_01262]|uniref:hypothetical protein n=1 Tax=Streptomyces sp. NBC_01262 TaxID=2903803 RepID=UPI002E3500CC|nr:hypothetical protein [Streptomyces sp. NBC_01262]
MAGYYKVELEALAQLTTKLGECADEMRSAMALLKDIGPKGSGFADLEKACDDFQDSWGYGIGLIADATGGITEGLSATHTLYETMEQNIAQSFQSPGKAEGN